MAFFSTVRFLLRSLSGNRIQSDRRTGILPFCVIVVTVIVILCQNCLRTSALPVFVSNNSNSVNNKSNQFHQEEVGVKGKYGLHFGDFEEIQRRGPISPSLEGPVIIGGTEEEEVEYEVGKVIRCAAYGKSKPIVIWEYYGKPLEDDLLVSEESSQFIDLVDLGYLNDTEASEAILNSTLQQRPQEQHFENSIRKQSDDLTSNSLKLRSNNLNLNPNKAQDSQNNDTIETLDTPSDPKMMISWVDFKLPKLNMALYGEFECVAENNEGVSTKMYYIYHNANSSVFMKLVRGSIALTLLVISILAHRFCLWYGAQKKHNRYAKLPLEDLEIVQRFRRGIEEEGLSPSKSNISNNSTETTSLSVDNSSNVTINSWSDFISYNERKEILKENFKIDFDNALKSKENGEQVVGKIRCPKTMKYSKVAVKTQHEDKLSSNFEVTLRELKILASLPQENFCIVNLQAAFTKKLYKREVYLFLDFCQNGPLDKFIDLNKHKFRDFFANKNQKQGHPNGVLKRPLSSSDPDSPGSKREKARSSQTRQWSFSCEDIIVWSAEIADGMKFLHRHKVIHGNICTANVYLSDELVAKVGNIGLSPKISFNANDSNSIPNPPECRIPCEYSAKSDIWSYGMTLWEIFSLRQLNNLPTEQDITDFYENGKPLLSAQHSNNDIKVLIESCWNPEPNLRPDFTHLSENLRRILQEF